MGSINPAGEWGAEKPKRQSFNKKGKHFVRKLFLWKRYKRKDIWGRGGDTGKSALLHLSGQNIMAGRLYDGDIKDQAKMGN